MPIQIPSALTEFILLGPFDDRRLLQDSPILGDVWVEYGNQPDKPADLLIVPYKTQHAGKVADTIYQELSRTTEPANIAYLQGLVAANLTFDEVLRVVVPKTKWWYEKWKGEPPTSSSTPNGGLRRKGIRPGVRWVHPLSSYNARSFSNLLTTIISAAKPNRPTGAATAAHWLTPLDRFLALAGLLLWARDAEDKSQPAKTPTDAINNVLDQIDPQDISRRLESLKSVLLNETRQEPLVWQVSRNRDAVPALAHSVPAVKADAVRTVFQVDCSAITWAVIDSGIDATHPCFREPDGNDLRVKRSFDFREFRRIVCLDNADDRVRKVNVDVLMGNQYLLNKPKKPSQDLKELAKIVENEGPIRWDLIEKFVEIDRSAPPQSNHGTHVAGIIGASKAAAIRDAGGGNDDFADGMCPDIVLYDFRVLAPDLKQTEFAIIAALQYIRQLNDRDNFFSIHGANLSLSIPHNVRNAACGSTPICNECTRLADSGVVVVAAAGNHGYKSFQTSEGPYDGYTAFSITDPGNADAIITVGATHREKPHTYGVSYFSSRGPTGDGRLKPDLVAPGERIRAPMPGKLWGDLNGTSMAAPHVSGAAAMLLARYPEFIGKSRRIKEILCNTATDLGRERTFQGHGMLDVLRAFQSI